MGAPPHTEIHFHIKLYANLESQSGDPVFLHYTYIHLPQPSEQTYLPKLTAALWQGETCWELYPTVSISLRHKWKYVSSL